MEKIKLGFALTGSFCTFAEVLPEVERLVERGYDVYPIMSEFAYQTDTRFGRAADVVERLERVTGNPVLHSIVDTEPIGPKKRFDLIVIAPCTGNTLGKLHLGITDTCVTMAAKAHLRNQRPLLIAVSTNDALGNSGKNIGGLLNARDVYFVPMRQDHPTGKPRSVVADFRQIEPAIQSALQNQQIQPIYV